MLLNSEPLFNENFTEVASNSEPFPNDNFTDIDILPNPEQLIDDNFESISNLNSNDYLYNLAEGDYFNDWESVNIFMHKYCLERGFGYQICRSKKDPNDFTIRRKIFKCSSSSIYKAQKVVDQTLHRLWGTIKTDCKWYCNFTFPKSVQHVKY